MAGNANLNSFKLYEAYLRVGAYQHENEFPAKVQVKINYMEDYKTPYKFSVTTCML